MTAFADVHNLTIPEAYEQDGGNYMVKAVNKAGEAKCYAKLVVKPAQQPATELMIRKAAEPRRAPGDSMHSPPEFIRLFQDKVARPGEAVTFDCLITGSPKPKVELTDTIAQDKALFVSKEYLHFSYFSTKTYVLVIIRSASARSF